MAASSAFPCWLSEVVLWGCNWLDELVPQHSQPFFVLADSLWDLGSLRERLVERSTSDGVCSTASDVFYIKHQMTFPSFLVAPLNWRLKSQNTQLQSSIPADLPSSKPTQLKKASCTVENYVWVAAELTRVCSICLNNCCMAGFEFTSI